MPIEQAIKEAAYKLDPECWVSYSGKPIEFKRAMEVRRVSSMLKAKEQMSQPIDVGPREPKGEVHLGDGLYCSFDGHMIKLRAPRQGGDDVVYLEPEVLSSFLQYLESLGHGRK